jgi:hypothetical protein
MQQWWVSALTGAQRRLPWPVRGVRRLPPGDHGLDEPAGDPAGARCVDGRPGMGVGRLRAAGGRADPDRRNLWRRPTDARRSSRWGRGFCVAGAAVALSAQSITEVWIEHALLGVGAAALPPMTRALVGHAVPDPRARGKCIGLWTASMMGPRPGPCSPWASFATSPHRPPAPPWPACAPRPRRGSHPPRRDLPPHPRRRPAARRPGHGRPLLPQFWSRPTRATGRELTARN